MNSILWERGSQWESQNWKASFIKGGGSHFGGSGQDKWWEIDYKNGLQKKSTTVTNILHATFTSTKWVSWLQNETTHIWIHHSLYNVYISEIKSCLLQNANEMTILYQAYRKAFFCFATETHNFYSVLDHLSEETLQRLFFHWLNITIFLLFSIFCYHNCLLLDFY